MNGPVWTHGQAKAGVAIYGAMAARVHREGLADIPVRDLALDDMSDEIVDVLIAAGFNLVKDAEPPDPAYVIGWLEGLSANQEVPLSPTGRRALRVAADTLAFLVER